MSNNVKLLKVNVKGCNIYENSELTFELYNSKRVNQDDEDSLNHLFSNIYTSPVNAIVGINASGKSSTLELLSAAIELFVEGKSISRTKLTETKMEALLFSDDNEVTFEVYLYNGNKSEILELISTITYSEDQEEVIFKNEILKKKKVVKTHRKKELCEFDGIDVYIERTADSSDVYISDDLSIIRMEIEKSKQVYRFIGEKQYHAFLQDGKKNEEIIQYLDSAINKLEKIENDSTEDFRRQVKIKYQDGKEQIIERRKMEQILSSGTNKGIALLPKVIQCLKQGGYLIIDEIENNFNKSIVADILKLFLSKRTNPRNASLIFSTHYAEIIDNIDRNDFVYITHKSSDVKIRISRFSDVIQRGDIKKSDAIMSDYLGIGTAPSSKAYKALRNFIEKEVSVRGEING